jgi:DNA invertase Pin-like site-specific DNA recombinase
MKHRGAIATMPSTVRKLRCAIYTRVSTDENLDQAYNSLHAQGDACSAYVQSQQAEGWLLNPNRYDDGGFSGGTLERPALQRLVADIKAGRVDVIVVYKIDRLSRSLTDFAKLVEVMEAHGVTFVSVTQSFNTTTSMGRLTLNILLSFAQFEREVIGERIRDKFAASRKRGIWMGGSVPLGYDIANRKLVVNEQEAETVRRIFDGFAKTGSATTLTKSLQAEQVATKRGRSINKSDIYKIIHNRTYVGEVAHKGNVYPGEHLGIITRERWDEVHAILIESPRAPGEQEPGTIAGASSRADLRGRRANAFTNVHPTAWPAISLLCKPVCIERDRRQRQQLIRPGASRVGCRDRRGGG